MIPRIRAIAIDDDHEHLQAIHEAATAAAIGCIPLRHPDKTDANYLEELKLSEALVRIVICDLHLEAGAQLGDAKQSFRTIGSLVFNLKLLAWTPYVLVLWTKYPNELEGLREYLETALPPEHLPTSLVSLDKTKYGIGVPGGAVDTETLWKDLRDEIQGSNGLNLIFQWEAELLESADSVMCSLIKLARTNPADGKPRKEIRIGEHLDRVVTLIAQTATSTKFAKDNPREAANEGLLPLLTDNIQHLCLEADAALIWDKGLSKRNVRQKATALEASFLNDAFMISRTSKINGSHRGAVLDEWHSDVEFLATFGVKKTELKDVFGFKDVVPDPLRIKYVQLEGACDSAQQKKGAVPFILGCEVPAEIELKPANSGSESRPASVEVSPAYRDADDKEVKLVVNLRFFFTASRDIVKGKDASFRIRDALAGKWAFSWATHAIRPGIIEFMEIK